MKMNISSAPMAATIKMASEFKKSKYLIWRTTRKMNHAMGSEKKISCTKQRQVRSRRSVSIKPVVFVATYQNADTRQEPGPRVDAEPEKDKEQTENRQHAILLNNAKQDFENQDTHKVVGIDFGMGVIFGETVHFIQKLIDRKAVRTMQSQWEPASVGTYYSPILSQFVLTLCVVLHRPRPCLPFDRPWVRSNRRAVRPK